MKGQGRSVSPLIGYFSMPAEKAARVLLRRANAGRSRIVFGLDAHFMSDRKKAVWLAKVKLQFTIIFFTLCVSYVRMKGWSQK